MGGSGSHICDWCFVPSPACCSVLMLAVGWGWDPSWGGGRWGGVRLGALGWGKAVAQARADGRGISLPTVSSSVLSPLSQALPYLPQIVHSSPGHHILWRPVRSGADLVGKGKNPRC